ncbi:serine/threonine-protein phosphatase 6 regulatory ankyrin repeat subunit A [Patella vulgata]|uniref:serine/threonine-protein phosphatase 6 regulatory ankyrin repeat subunit A n=1 Tax=Patella vulgata TaxID=6465 RepID=UPI0024A9C1C5|nr:serine/threonine-protein phosphatase 6 regulatory ankyrin repeat subunit A [Patella vulgata]
MEEETYDEIDLSPHAIFMDAIQTDNEDIFFRHIGIKRKDRRHPIDIQIAAIECCKYRRVEMLKSLLTLRPNLNFQDLEGKRVLHHAAIIGSLEITQLSIKGGSSVNCYDAMSYCPIHYACENGHADIVQYLLTRGAHVTFSKIYSTGESPLHVACRAGHVEVVKVLLKNGADIHSKLDLAKSPCYSYSPLHIAVKNGKWEVVEALCSQGAMVNMKSSKGHTPLHLSAYYGQLTSTKLLLEFAADVSVKDSRGDTALLNAIFEGHVETVRLLLQWEPNVSLQGGDTMSAIFAALTGPEIKIFELVIQAGADIDERKPDTLESVLMVAVGLADMERSKYLIQNNADVNLGDIKMYTPLHRVQIIKAPDSIKIELSENLIKAGAKINALDKDGFTPLHRAIFTNVIRSSQALPCIKLLVEAGSRLWPGPTVQNRNSQSPLCWLTWNNQLQVAEYLVQAGWDMSCEFWVNLKPSRPQQAKLHLIFQEITYNTRSLKHCCRNEIRDFLSDITCDREIKTSIELLPLPNSLKNYLSLHDCDFKDPSYFENL